LSEILKNAEELCSGILESINSLPSLAELSREELDDLKIRVEEARGRLAKARKKIVMRTPKGKELSRRVNDRLLELHNLLKDRVEKGGPHPLSKILEEEVEGLEEALDKIETYYRSYEAELT